MLVADDADAGHDEMAFLRFETLTLCPIDTRLIDRKLLTSAQRDWLNQYHKTVREALIGDLNTTEAAWLRGATKKL